MDFTRIRKLSLKVFIGFLGLTAAVAIISVLSGEFGWLQEKILATCFTISAASICSMSCAAFIERKKHVALGMTGIILCAVSATLFIAGFWSEIENEVGWKITITLGVFAIGFAHAFLLSLPELPDSQKWIQKISAVSIGILALQIVIALWAEIEDNDWYYRILAVVAIFVGLETLVIPILMKLTKADTQKKDRLVLQKIDGDIYTDTTGNRFRLTQLDTAPADTPNS